MASAYAGVVLVAVEAVLGVVDDELAVLLEKPHGVVDHRQVLFGRRLQHFADVQQPGLAEDRDDRRRGVEEQPHLVVVGRRATSLRRVDPNAASRACVNVRCFASSKNSMSFGFEPGQPPSM